METDNIGDAAMDLVAAVCDLFETEAARDAVNAPQLQRALSLIRELHPYSNPSEGSELPGCRHLSRALDLGEAGAAASVAKALRRLEPELAWFQNPRYNAENKGVEFMDNYGWSPCCLAGSDELSFGVLLLGPGVTYPPTRYESEGVFLVVGGSPEWKSGDEPWVCAGPGDIFCRQWNGAEGKRTGDEPMLALYAWMYS